MTTLDDLLLAQLREGSRRLWRGTRARLCLRAILPALLAQLGFFGGLWLLQGCDAAFRWSPGVRAGALVLAFAALLGGLGLAWVDSLRAVVVTGALLRSLGDALLDAPFRSAGRRPAEWIGVFGSRDQLARAMRFRDLPLLLFLGRVVFRLEVRPLLGAPHAGLGRERLVRELERLARARAAALLRRLSAGIWLCLGALLLLVLLIARVLP